MQQTSASTSTLRQVLRRLCGYRTLIILSLLLALGNVAATLYVPILIGRCD